MIKLSSISKTYETNNLKINAIKEINLNIEKGEMVAIMGRSGAGKSTLLNILGLIDKQTNGTYLLNSIDVKNLTEKEMAHCRNELIGFVVQNLALIEEYTVLQNIEIPLIYSRKKLKKEEIKKRVKNTLESVGLKEKLKSYTYNLSGGERQRIAIARAIVNDPDIIVADEPTGSLDSKTARDIMKIFLDLNKKGKTIIIVTHDEQISSYCNRVIYIEDGRIDLNELEVWFKFDKYIKSQRKVRIRILEIINS